MCHMRCNSRPHLIEHLRRKHNRNNEMFRCELCGKHFSQKIWYEKHKNAHFTTRNVCSFCGLSFSNGKNFKQHIYSHTGERPIKCKYEGCDKSFRSYSGRRIHMRINHQNLKQYQCRINGCTEEFGGVVGYKKHKLAKHGIPMKKK